MPNNLYKINNNTPIDYTSDRGITFRSDTADLRFGVIVLDKDWQTSDRTRIGADFLEFGAWHSREIHPYLNGFSGYDTITFAVEKVKEENE